MPSHLDPEQLIQGFIEFAQATSGSEAERVLEQYPELLDHETDTVLRGLMAVEMDKDALELLEENRDLLHRCRTSGVAHAFAEEKYVSEEAVPAEKIPDANDPISYALTVLPAEQREALIDMLARADSPEALNAMLGEQPYLHAALNAALSTFTEDLENSVPASLQDLIQRAQEVEEHYQRTGNVDALDAAIDAREHILAYPAFSQMPNQFQLAMLNDTGGTYLSRYQANGALEDMDRALVLLRKALAGTPRDAMERAARLNNLGAGLYERYLRTGELSDLEATLKVLQESVATTPLESPDRAARLSNLGLALRDRYARSGAPRDLELAIEVAEQAVADTPSTAPTRASHLSNLGTVLSARYELSGALTDLESAIEAYEQAVATNAKYLSNLGVPPDTPDSAMYANNLGNGLRQRYRRSGSLDDIGAAIDAYERAVAVSQPDASRRAKYLNNLGAALRDRYKRSGELGDLEAAIDSFDVAVEATPPGAHDWASRLGNLGLGLLDYYARSGAAEVLEVAIDSLEQAVEATPTEAPGRAATLSYLATGLRERYSNSSVLEDLEAAIQSFEEAVEATPPEAPERAHRLNNLGNSLRERYGHTGQLADLEASQSAYRSACESGLETSLEPVLMSARSWGNWALERHAWEEAAEAYNYGEKALERLLEVQLLRSAKETWLHDVQGLSMNAAYALARSGALERAVEVIENGRARLLAQALELSRHDLEQLPERGHDALLTRYRKAAERWEGLIAGAERSSEEPLPDAVAWRGKLTDSRAELGASIDAIRQVPGYADFLRNATWRHICDAAGETPLVYLIATTAGGVALILSPIAEGSDTSGTYRVQAVWLDALTDAAVREQLQGTEDSQELGGYLGTYAHWHAKPENAEAYVHWLNQVETTTHWLWDMAVGLPLEAAVGAKEATTPAIVLVPTGLLALLPLHAAWTEDPAASDGRRYALDVASIRYAPNARALTAARAHVGNTSTERLLLCVDPQPVSTAPLPAAKQEALDVLRNWPQGTYTVLRHEAATHEELVTQLPEHTCLHFAGHAFAGWDQPQHGGLLMASDQVLTVGELTRMQLPLRLAILSACETGMPGTQLPDEVIGLPTALMEAGAAGVVASLWSVPDNSTAQLMAHFHHLLRHQELPPPEALRLAQIELRDKRDFSHPFYWACFAYTGL